jgi:hypothetical protein
MNRISLFLSILSLILTMSVAAVSAQETEPISLPPPPKEGAISGVVTHIVQVTDGDDETMTEKGRFGQVENIISLVTTDSMLDSSVTWTLRSRLKYYDYGNSEDVKGASDNWTDTSVYKLEVLGELYRNGDRLWHNYVPACCNVTHVSSGFSHHWYTGYNAFWQSKGTHYKQNTSGSGWNVETSEASKQF